MTPISLDRIYLDLSRVADELVDVKRNLLTLQAATAETNEILARFRQFLGILDWHPTDMENA